MNAPTPLTDDALLSRLRGPSGSISRGTRAEAADRIEEYCTDAATAEEALLRCYTAAGGVIEDLPTTGDRDGVEAMAQHVLRALEPPLKSGGEIDRLRAERDELTELLTASTAARRDMSSKIGDLSHHVVMARAMLRSLVNGWQSDMTAAKGYDSLVWDARAVLDHLDGVESPCPYCTIPGMDCYHDQGCLECVKRMADPPLKPVHGTTHGMHDEDCR